ncbi:hypothetical protein CRENBAI_009306, partial [Crenichthys baileyi]
AQRYKPLHKYEYRYEAESLNAINGASQLKNGPKASCKVEIEVPRMCSFIMHTTGCSLMEVVDVDAVGNPVFLPAASTDDFAAEMKRYPLKFVVEGEYDVKLYPEDGETTTILNFKRGIVSGLAVPLLEEDKNKNMPTIHGKCRTSYTNNAREDIVTDISLHRDLSRCDKFVPIRDHNSPLALITGMHYPMAQMVRSSQTCNYKFDNEKKHMTSGSCTEEHLLIPFSHKGKYGFTNVGKQELTLVQVSSHNDRAFEHDNIVKDLNMEVVEDKSTIQDKDAAVKLMRELVNLPETEGERRAHLFHTLISTVRGMKTETLRAALPEAVAVSRFLTYQVLAQCGTPECSSAIMQILRTFDISNLEVDAAVFALGFMSNPSSLLINDLLEMAKYKPSKPIMYALSNVVKRFYKAENKIIPEIHSVAEFMASQLGDCSGAKEHTFMTLRVIGNMAPAVIPFSPALRTAVIQCAKQPAASQKVQQAAIQVYRQIPVPNEISDVFMQVLLDNSNPVQERIAAYLIIMKDPKPSELTQLTNALSSETNQQFKSFVISHITNILSSTEPETKELRQKIQDALQGNKIGPTMDPMNFSRNYKIGSVQGNMIFEGVSYLPKEVMLEMTLRAFGFEIDMMEIGMAGEGFEPTIEALFGEGGFFPDTALKTMYFVSENMPQAVSEILENIIPALKKNRMRREASNWLMREIGQNLEKLVKELKAAESPEAVVYLKLLGNELGYLGTNDIAEMTYSAGMMIDKMLRMFPHEILRSLMTNPDTTIFAHYIFMDNEFFLPTVTGMPLRIALSGTFTPGFKGGLQIARDMTTVSFMPFGGIEFVTQVGSHIPKYVNSGLEMHTNIFHESGIRAQLSMGHDHVKLTIPAPTNPTKLIKMTNSLVAVTGSDVRMIPPVVMDKVDVNKCTPAFTGMKYCSALQYTDAFSHETAPYFPLTGDSKFSVELHPTGEVTEYTATVLYELLKEGDQGRQKIDVLKFILRAEGAEPTEAQLVMKYNRRKNVITADVQIPDFDVEAGLRLGVVDGKTKGKGTYSISLDFINKNIPQLSLIGRANLKDMKEGMLQVQFLVPSISAESTVTASLKHNDHLKLGLESEIKVMDATSEQKIEMKYDGRKIELEFKSDVNTKTTSLPNGDAIHKYGNEILDMQVVQTDMKVRHIFRKFAEAANNYMEKYGAEMLPYMQHFRLPDIPDISLPEKLFLNTDAKAVFYFNNDCFTVVVPLPFGGKTTAELNFPPVLTTPSLHIPQFGLEVVSREIPIPDLVVPKSLTVSVPLFGKVELSALMNSNLYEVEATLGVGKDVVEPPSYSARFDAKGSSPIDILSVAVEGSGMVSMTESIKAHLRSSFTHKFFEASFSIEEDGVITDKITFNSKSKMEATSQFGLNAKLQHTSVTEVDTQHMFIDSNFEGSFKAGPIYGTLTSLQVISAIPFKPEAKIDSKIQFDSTIFKAENQIIASLSNGELFVNLNTKAFEDIFTHAAVLSFKDSELVMKCDASAYALGLKIHNQAEASAGAGKATIRIETNGDHSDNRVYSLLMSTFDANGLTVGCNANMKLFENEATHEAKLKMNKDGLSTSGTTTLQSPLSLENTFSAGIDATRATLYITNKAAVHDIKVDNSNTLTITLSSLDFNSKAEAVASEYSSYIHDITFNLKPHTASAKIINHMKLLEASFDNDARLQAELYKIDLTGKLKAMYGEEEIKHTYQINYADLSANAKCSTTGKLFGTHMSHNTELEIVGLAARFSNDARFNSQPIRFDHTIRCNFVPFDFNLDAMLNGDGDITIYGQHSAQLYSKLLIRAQPLAFISSHECRASVTQKLDNGLSFETTYDNNIDTVLSPHEQITRFRIKSKMNEHEFNQGIQIYNNEERVGIEVHGTILTNTINSASTENQDFTISGFLKYDKSTHSHIIHVPLIESLPVFMESIKEFVVVVAESLKDLINNKEVRARLEALPQEIENVDAILNNLMNAIQIFLGNLSSYIQTFIDIGGNLHDSLSDLVVPSIKLELNNLGQIEIPTKLDMPEFTIMGMYTVKAFTVSFDDIKQEIIELIDFIVNFKIKMPDPDALFGDLALNYLPTLPDITLPEIPLFEVTFPNIPKIDAEKFAKALEIPKMELPSIPNEIILPCFGKLYGEIKLLSPIYAMKTSAEFQNSTENKMTPLFTGSFSSQGMSSSLEILNYNLETNVRIAVPKMKRVVLAETITFKHTALGLEHQASVTLYGLSAQAQAQAQAQTKTTVKVSTAPYSANLMNTAFIALAGGMTSTLETTYNHVVNIPFADISSEVTTAQKSTVQQNGLTLNFEVDSIGTGKFNSHDCNHKSKFNLSLSPKTGSLSFTGNTESDILKLKQLITAESGTFSYFKFHVLNEAVAPLIKSSLFVASGLANLNEMKIEMKANQNTELYGADSGVLSNAVNFKVHPGDIFFETQNKANAKVNIFKSVNAKIELQNDYLVSLKPDFQKVNAAFLARLNQYKMFSNFTVDNTRNHAGVFVEMESQADLSFLEHPISIPEIDLPLVDFHTPPIDDLNLFEKTGLKKILSTTEQTVNMDAKIFYLKSNTAPLIDEIGLIQIPSMGKLSSELSLKSAIINLNVETFLSAEDDLVLRLGATTNSVFECLNTKLKGTTSLTTKRGIKIANSVSLENRHIKGTHDSTYSMNTVSVVTASTIVLPILNLEVRQNLIADTKSKPNALSTLTLKGDFNIAMIKAVGKVEAEHSLKVEGGIEYLSVESSLKTNMDSTAFENYLVLGVLDNEANMYLNTNIVRSTCKIIADAKVNHGTTKIIGMDVNHKLAAEASVDRIFAEITHSSNNEANIFSFKTEGKHSAKATIDFSPSSLKADVEIDITQPSSLGDFAYSEKTVAEINPSKQKVSTNAKLVSPMYTTNMVADVDGSVPVLKITFKSSATSAFVILEYDIDGSTTVTVENDLLNMASKLVLTHSDLSMDVNHVIIQALSALQHKLNLDITSPTFTDLNLRYAAHSDAISASISTPSTGFLGLQFNCRDPSHMSARLYGRYSAAPETDVDILLVRFSKTNMQIVYNMKAPEDMIAELKTRLPSMMSSVKAFADKYQITSSMEMVQHFVINHVNEAYNVAINHDAQMSQVSTFFRNTIVRYQKKVENLLNAVIKVLRETRFKLPGSDELITLPKLLKKLTDSIANMLDVTIQFICENMEMYYDYFLEKISNVEVQLPSNKLITGRQIIDKIKASAKKISDEVVDFVRNMESLDSMLEKLDYTLKAVVEKTQEFVDSIKSDYLDAVFNNFNELYREVVTYAKKMVDQIPPFNLDEISKLCESIMDTIIELIDQFNNEVYGFLQQMSEEAYMTTRDGKLEINLPLHFQD